MSDASEQENALGSDPEFQSGFLIILAYGGLSKMTLLPLILEITIIALK